MLPCAPPPRARGRCQAGATLLRGLGTPDRQCPECGTAHCVIYAKRGSVVAEKYCTATHSAEKLPQTINPWLGRSPLCLVCAVQGEPSAPSRLTVVAWEKLDCHFFRVHVFLCGDLDRSCRRGLWEQVVGKKSPRWVRLRERRRRSLLWEFDCQPRCKTLRTACAGPQNHKHNYGNQSLELRLIASGRMLMAELSTELTCPRRPRLP